MTSITTLSKTFWCWIIISDSENLTYEIKSEDTYEEYFNHRHLPNFGNYPKDSKFFDQTNKNVIGKMKNKLEGKIIDEFVGLKSMMYSMNLIQQKEKISRLNLMNLKTLYLTENTQKQNERNSKEKHKVGT